MFIKKSLGLFIIPIRFKNLNEYPFKYLSFCEMADINNFHEIYVGEHLTDSREDICSSLLFCSYLASTTKNILLCPSVLPLPHYNIKLLTKQFIELARISNYRVRLGIGPGALNTDLEYLGINPIERYSIYDKSLDELLKSLSIEWPKEKELSIFSTVLGVNPKKVNLLRNKKITFLTSNFCHPKWHINHINNYGINNFKDANGAGWKVCINYLPSNVKAETEEIFFKTFQYIESKLDKNSSMIMKGNDYKIVSTNINDFTDLIFKGSPKDLIEHIQNSPLVNADTIVLNLFDCLDDPTYVESILEVGKLFKSI